MSIFAGLDVSDKTTHVCVVDADGAVLKRDVVASDPELLAKWLDKHCPGLVRVVLGDRPSIDVLVPWPDRAKRPRGVHLRSACQRRVGGSREQE
jgi:transposase